MPFATDHNATNGSGDRMQTFPTAFSDTAHSVFVVYLGFQFSHFHYQLQLATKSKPYSNIMAYLVLALLSSSTSVYYI